ncbi:MULTISPECIES: DNA sulfur modification protein DndB [Aeromonas]|uniref:DNA sulfur modification protein DndB n=1 Tax=Aeromonas TaxID=642 RepID=UPI0011169B7F|nr:DNA sulfur modification protein DndB [Aeromonas veronii]TNI98259.1 hypothetical protein CF114_10195 [Aeromonas veronii]
MSMKMKKTFFGDFNKKIHGAYGTFTTPSGKVNYLQVTARITTSGVDLSDELAGSLVPVREILDTKEMNFGELLQRDLDDYRVASDLVPYILNGSDIGPSYFPPIQAMLLPFNVSDENLKPKPKENFGDYIETPVEHDDIGLAWKGYQHEESFKFEKLSFDDGTIAPYREGRLQWHDKRAKLVVIDGQHRAMAMLAIYRTIHKTWKGAGSQYRHFYENEINTILKNNDGTRALLSNGIEYPVTIMWFDNSVSHHRAARKLFVDVNKNAKPPTQSRLILLGEEELRDIFTRTILNNLRQEEETVPIYAIEYDYNNSSSSQVGKWSALVNIEMIKAAIKISVWGPNKYISCLDTRVSSGRDNNFEMDSRFRKQLNLSSWYPDEHTSPNGDIYAREKVGNVNFPKDLTDKFELEFMRTWGRVIVNILTKFLPYSAHIKALDALKVAWADVDNEASLGYEAIFDGVGLYWTLKDAFSHWNQSGNGDVIPDTVKSWRYINKKEQEFYAIRSKYYFDRTDKLDTAQDIFSKVNTYACLVGIVAAIASIAEKFDLSGHKLNEFSLQFIQMVNDWLLIENRRAFFSTKVQLSFIALPKLDQPFWVYFRYFFFEIIASYIEDSHEHEMEEEYLIYINAELVKLRKFYFETVIYSEQRKAIEKVSDKEGSELDEEIMKISNEKYNKIMKKWFNKTWSN